MSVVTLTIDNQQVTVPAGTTVLEAARKAGVNIPTLCYLKGINEVGSCRICVVEANKSIQTACVHPVSEGMVVRTNTKRVRELRKGIFELIIANHNADCTICARNLNCELQRLGKELGVETTPYLKSYPEEEEIVSPTIVRDNSRCINCGRCVRVCDKVQEAGVLAFNGRSDKMFVSTFYDAPLEELSCINCGQCIVNCPVGALKEKDQTAEVWAALNDPAKYVIVQTAPAVRAALGEEFGMPIGTPVTGKMAAALRRLGFKKVFDTDFAADVTIMEEGTELLGRVEKGGVLPMITSCSPGWIKFCEHNYPDLLDNLSTCKSPQNMMGALLKSHYAEMAGINPDDIVVVSVMPCTAKKFEVGREELEVDGRRDVDISITTRELAKMIKQADIDFTKLPDEDFDEFYGDSTGAAVIFGVTGGVMEAALRTLADILSGKDLQNVEYHDVRGLEGVREAEIEVKEGLKLKVALVHGGSNIKKLMDQVRSGKAPYHFIEVMACPGGCIMGGGQPIVSDQVRAEIDVAVERAKALYSEDEKAAEYRKSHQNPSVKRLYDEYLKEPNGHLSHKLLHTHYQKRG